MKRFVCLAYHRIADDPSDRYAIPPWHFERQMAWLAGRNYHGVSVSRALHTSTDRCVALTFDDGYTDFSQNAWPVLQAYGFQATVFIVTRQVGSSADWPEARGDRLMDWPDLLELASAGVEIGAHGASHVALDHLSVTERNAQLGEAFEVIMSRFGSPEIGFAYPYGRTSHTLADAVEQAGYAWACTARGGVNRPQISRYYLRRTLVTGQRIALNVLTGYAQIVDLMMDIRQIQ